MFILGILQEVAGDQWQARTRLSHGLHRINRDLARIQLIFRIF